MWQILRDLLIGLSIFPVGLMLTGSGVAGLWYLLTKAESTVHYLIMVISPIQTAAGLFMVYKSYDYVLSIFGIHIASWFWGQ